MAKRRKKGRRTRTDHRGVKVLEVTHRSGRTSWVARYTDPDTGRVRQESLEQHDAKTATARRAWAVRKAEELRDRRVDLSRGSPRHTGEALADAVEYYFDTKGKRLGQRHTVKSYRAAAERFLAWTKLSGIKLCDDLRPEHLAAFKEWLAVEPAMAPVKGGTRSDREATGRTCAAAGVNSRIRSVKAVLNHLRRLGRLAHVTSDDIKDRLKPLPEPKTKPRILRRKGLKQLLQAALRHDRATHVMTRAEKGAGRKGGTPKYDAIAPFVVYGLLSGCRLEEILTTPVDAVDIDAPDDQGNEAGEIYLDADVVKTKEDRRVDLAVSPALRRLVAALKLKAGGAVYLFGGDEPWTRSKVDPARRRLVDTFGAPAFNWSQTRRSKKTPSLRATCGSNLANAPGIYGAASAYRAAKQLGHSVAIAEKHYLGLVRGIPATAQSLEAAMGIEEEVDEVIRRLVEGYVQESTTDKGDTPGASRESA